MENKEIHDFSSSPWPIGAKEKKDMRAQAINLVHVLFPDTSQEIKAGVFFGELHNEVYEQYKSEVDKFVTPDMETDVLDDEILHRLAGSTDTLCYISGWLLNKLLDLNMSGVDKAVLRKFVMANSNTIESSKESGVPTSTIDRREKAPGALKRPNSSWFAWTCLIEAIFVVNTNALQVLHHRGRIFEKITIAAGKSDALRQRFYDCVKQFEPHEIKQLWKVHYCFIVPVYSALKSSDVLKLIREARPYSAQDRLPTRAYALTMHERAKNS